MSFSGRGPMPRGAFISVLITHFSQTPVCPRGTFKTPTLYFVRQLYSNIWVVEEEDGDPS